MRCIPLGILCAWLALHISSSGFSSLSGGLLASCSYSREPDVRKITSCQAHDSETHAQNHKT
ncbi:hypothetical protein POPTR_007G051401v4 [Populus trichocarpa]|uniref:Uncharacterized protein n=1 Tax=Populus trichocarpa TaxID=3694 RepID=A0ACC0SPN2_POPTR|nr:hypothetical protein POPTR_007G051401v4 [Populus trichocarpa]